MLDETRDKDDRKAVPFLRFFSLCLSSSSSSLFFSWCRWIFVFSMILMFLDEQVCSLPLLPLAHSVLSQSSFRHFSSFLIVSNWCIFMFLYLSFIHSFIQINVASLTLSDLSLPNRTSMNTIRRISYSSVSYVNRCHRTEFIGCFLRPGSLLLRFSIYFILIRIWYQTLGVELMSRSRWRTFFSFLVERTSDVDEAETMIMINMRTIIHLIDQLPWSLLDLTKIEWSMKLVEYSFVFFSSIWNWNLDDQRKKSLVVIWGNI